MYVLCVYGRDRCPNVHCTILRAFYSTFHRRVCMCKIDRTSTTAQTVRIRSDLGNRWLRGEAARSNREIAKILRCWIIRSDTFLKMFASLEPEMLPFACDICLINNTCPSNIASLVTHFTIDFHQCARIHRNSFSKTRNNI